MGLLYLLDTNVLSEATRRQPNPGLLARLEQELAAGTCATCAIVLYELYRGALLHPDAPRSATLLEFAQEWRAMIPVLPYDAAATYWQAEEAVRLQRLGRPISLDDAQIAACAVANDLTLVTHNMRHFNVFRTLRLEGESRELREAKRTRDAAAEALRAAYVQAGTYYESLFRMAGLDELADTLRPTARRATSVEEPPAPLEDPVAGA